MSELLAESVIPFDPTEPEEDVEKRRIAARLGLPGFYHGNKRRGEFGNDLCSEHGPIDEHTSIAGHLAEAHGMTWDLWNARVLAGVASRKKADKALAKALLHWYDTTHGNEFGHDHHCPVPWSDQPHLQEPDDRCTCGWSAVLAAERARSDGA